MSLTLVTSDRFADHLTPPGHPEHPGRAGVMQTVAWDFRRRGGAVLAPQAADEADILRIHDPNYVMSIRETAGHAVALDPDTFTSPDSYDVALLAVGAVITAIDDVMSGPSRRSLAMVRPPGHHAERGRAMGFCLFNNVAIGAAYARAHGVARVAIVDFDVHHGNGTQASFYSDPSVLFVSSHQYPYYPGTGSARETGSGPGVGFTVNLPLEVGATDEDFAAVYDAVTIPILRQFKPNLILVSAGFDAHRDDPLGGMRVTSDGFARLTAALADVADGCCDGRLVAVTEGGYDLPALAESLRATIDVLDDVRPVDHEASSHPTFRAHSAIDATAIEMRRYWQL